MPKKKSRIFFKKKIKNAYKKKSTQKNEEFLDCAVMKQIKNKKIKENPHETNKKKIYDKKTIFSPFFFFAEFWPRCLQFPRVKLWA